MDRGDRWPSGGQALSQNIQRFCAMDGLTIDGAVDLLSSGGKQQPPETLHATTESCEIGLEHRKTDQGFVDHWNG